jgi:dihydroxy-acid dehydratase
VGISSVWYEGNPCNMHLMDLAAEVKKGVQDAGMVGYRCMCMYIHTAYIHP